MYTTRPIVTGRTGVLAAGHHLATSTGLKMFALGGNAVDAVVAFEPEQVLQHAVLVRLRLPPQIEHQLKVRRLQPRQQS